jgi:hypothetical protein
MWYHADKHQRRNEVGSHAQCPRFGSALPAARGYAEGSGRKSCACWSGRTTGCLGTFKLIDPGGLRAERACDLGTIMRCNPDAGDDLHARAKRLAAHTGVDATAIWEWGTIHRVIGGLYSRQIGFQPFGDLLLAEADRLTG